MIASEKAGPDLSPLALELDGRIIEQGDPEMVLANKQHAAALPFEPPLALIRCRTEADVARAVRFLGSRGERFSVRSGGHCFSDLSSCGNVQLDLAELNRVQFGPDHVRLGPGGSRR